MTEHEILITLVGFLLGYTLSGFIDVILGKV
jgi:hypothetical protein